MLLTPALMFVLGCGEDDFRHPVYPAAGKVISKGEPLAAALVRFHPADPARLQIPAGRTGFPVANPTTETKADGTFTLSTYLADDGVPAGDYTVTVLPGGGEDEDGDPDARPAASSAESARFPARYRDPATSTLKATVKPGAENRFDFTLD